MKDILYEQVTFSISKSNTIKKIKLEGKKKLLEKMQE